MIKTIFNYSNYLFIKLKATVKQNTQILSRKLHKTCIMVTISINVWDSCYNYYYYFYLGF